MKVVQREQKLNKSALSKMLIPLPPLDIQKRIAAALDTANALIEKRKEQIEKLDFLINHSLSKCLVIQ